MIPAMCGDADVVDVVVLGAGPAGLASGVSALDCGASLLAIERGLPVAGRSRHSPGDLVAGVGGAGLYSDGKFSYAPSATELWSTRPAELLRDAYAWTSELLGENGLEPSDFPLSFRAPRTGQSAVKEYRSEYMPLPARKALIQRLQDRLGPRLLTGKLGHLRVSERGIQVECNDITVRGRTAVVATGRFGPLQAIPEVPTRFKRVELGMRIEQPASRFALDKASLRSLVDPKWTKVSRDGALEWRTFCCCREGEVVTTAFGDLQTVSGRADGSRTQRSNFGLNVRFMDTEAAVAALAQSIEMSSGRLPSRLSARELLSDPLRNGLADRMGARTSAALAAGMDELASDLEVDLEDALLHFPAIEGVGYYPAVDPSLKAGERVWVAGDATGKFRGLVPAMVSGWMVGAQAAVASKGAGDG